MDEGVDNSKFLPDKLRDMIRDGHLKFGTNQEDIIVVDPVPFYEHIINKYVTGKGKASFKKQLSNYGFYQVAKQTEVYWAKGFTSSGTDKAVFGLKKDARQWVTQEEAARLYGRGPFRQKRSAASAAAKADKRIKTDPSKSAADSEVDDVVLLESSTKDTTGGTTGETTGDTSVTDATDTLDAPHTPPTEIVENVAVVTPDAPSVRLYKSLQDEIDQAVAGHVQRTLQTLMVHVKLEVHKQVSEMKEQLTIQQTNHLAAAVSITELNKVSS
jgi:hypothetical protein